MPRPKPIKPQPGPQEQFLSSTADIVIFGGAAFGGKSYALLMESTRNIKHSRYNGVIFRRESPQITSGGGLWDTASQIYPSVTGEPKEHKLTYVFPSKAYVKFTHLQHESDKLNHQGAQYVFIGFDELTHFTEGQFWYLITRNRPPDGYEGRSYCRATTNPEYDSWVRILIDWWIDPDTGYAIKERSGVIRYFTRIDDQIVWVDKDWTDEEGTKPRSITFIPSYIDDNPMGMAADPMYKSNLMAQDKVTRERLLRGNWNITYKGGMFNPDWFKIIPTEPEGIKWIRYWDRAATEPKDEEDDPDWTAGGLVGMHGGELYIKDMIRFRDTPAVNEKKISDAAKADRYDVKIGYEIEPGSSGVEIAQYYQTKVLKGYTVMLDRPTGNKVERCKPWCALAEHGHVYLIKGEWNRSFLAEAGGFPFGKKDQIDSISGAYKMLTMDKYVWPLFKMSMAKKFKLKWTQYTINLGGIFLSKNMEIFFIAAMWDRAKRHLYVYGELLSGELAPHQVANRIFEGAQLELHPTKGIYCNSLMVKANDMQVKSTGKILNEEINAVYKRKKQKRTVYIKEPWMYDRMGAINIANLMFNRDMITVYLGAKDASRQFASWYIDKDKPVEKNFELCECLTQIVSELNRTEKLKKPVDSGYPDYRTKLESPKEKMKPNDNWARV
ncbi:MAG: hypothetical protein GY861_12720 [bacterium]|nr:hypothetical protein [bacterium]